MMSTDSTIKTRYRFLEFVFELKSLQLIIMKKKNIPTFSFVLSLCVVMLIKLQYLAFQSKTCIF